MIKLIFFWDCSFLVVGNYNIILEAMLTAVFLMSMITALFIFVGDDNCNFPVFGDYNIILEAMLTAVFMITALFIFVGDDICSFLFVGDYNIVLGFLELCWQLCFSVFDAQCKARFML